MYKYELVVYLISAISADREFIYCCFIQSFTDKIKLAFTHKNTHGCMYVYTVHKVGNEMYPFLYVMF